MEKEMTNQNLQPIKLHIGCGLHLKEGYYNIDQYVSAPGILTMDIFNLEFETDSVDEIFTEHMLEHLGKYEVPLALKEWARVLKPDGKLVMNLPNLEWCMQQWLAKPEEKRWGWQLDTIFGLQTHNGEYHKTGFTEPRLKELLKSAGFKNIKISDYWSHEQSCFWVEASKGYSTKEVKCLASIVVPWWDHTDLLELWQENVKYLADAEIIFIDNGSAPEAKAALENFCHAHQIQLIRNETNLGFAAANNQGIKLAKNEYILNLNNDVKLRQNPINYLCQLAGEGLAGPGYLQNELGEIYVEGWALCIKKYVLEAIGGWSEDYGPGYWDDVDLCRKATIAGFPVTPVPDISNWIVHLTNATGRDGRIDQIALHIKNRGIYLKKYYSCRPKILIDGVFFQLYKTGIARVWRSLLQEWSNQEFAKHIVVLDRVETAPKIPGIRYRTIPAYDYGDTDADKQMLQEICDEEGADIFISTYYTTPGSTPSVFMAYDMIPEVLGADFNQPVWREKHYGIQHASAYISISENTARDLAKVFPSIALDTIKVAHCGVASEFSPATPEEINKFQTKYGISKPYFLLVGINNNYKNAPLFLKAFSQLPTKQGFEIVAIGSGYLLSIDMRQYTSGVVVHLLEIEDAELKAAYSGAVALVYPSIYEGFGLPVLEALACGCPVIACPNASIPEVAGEAAIYVNHQDVDGWANALCEVQKPSLRQSMIAAGLAQAQKFSWSSMAENVSQALINATLLPLDLQTVNFIAFPDWQQPEESLGAELQAVLKAVATHPDKNQMTLLVYRGEMSEEDSNLMLSTVAMNLLMEEDLDVSEGPVISLVGELGPMQWQALLPRLQARIALQCDNKGAIAAAIAENLPTYTPENLP